MLVEIWSDVVCPWCYIGKRRFERALAEFEASHSDVSVTVAYRAFQLDPAAPTDRSELVQAVYEKKFGGPDQASAIIDRVTSEAADEGLDFRLDIAKRANTVLAHRLLVLAEVRGVQLELKERLMEAYFTQGGEIGTVDELVALGGDVGLDEQSIRGWLAGDGGKREVVEHLEFAASAGIHSVPTYVINREIGIPGAQPSDVFVQALEQAIEGRPDGQ